MRLDDLRHLPMEPDQIDVRVEGKKIPGIYEVFELASLAIQEGRLQPKAVAGLHERDGSLYIICSSQTLALEKPLIQVVQFIDIKDITRYITHLSKRHGEELSELSKEYSIK